MAKAAVPKAGKLARLLRPFGVVSGTIRLPDGKTPKGYLLDQFTYPFSLDPFLKRNATM